MPQDHRAVGGRTLEGFPDPPPRFCTVCETVSAVHGRVHPPHHLSPVQVPPGVPGHARGLSRCASVGYCYPTASQRDAPPRDGDPPRCGRAWPGTVHPVCTRRLPVAHACMLTVEPESVTELMNSVPVMPSKLLAEGAAVGSPLCLPYGSDPYTYRPRDPPPHEVDMPKAPADAEERPAAPADADAAPPPQSAAHEEEEMPAAPADAEAPAEAEERPAAPPPRQRRTSSLPTRSPSQPASCRKLSSRWTPRCPTWGTSSSCKRGCLRVCF